MTKYALHDPVATIENEWNAPCADEVTFEQRYWDTEARTYCDTCGEALDWFEELS